MWTSFGALFIIYIILEVHQNIDMEILMECSRKNMNYMFQKKYTIDDNLTWITQ